MGGLCSCFRVPEVEEEDTVESQISNHGNCRCTSCFIHNLKTKYRALFGSVGIHTVASPVQGAAPSSSIMAPNDTRIETGTCLPNSMNPPNPQSHLIFTEGYESSRKISLEKVDSGVAHVDASEDEDVCPTCLEEYTQENPKITTQCHHSYHLSCIYEWMERSENCPICAKLMVFNETT